MQISFFGPVVLPYAEARARFAQAEKLLALQARQK
jgi:hypothetical protein